MNEIWKNISGFNGLYQVSNLGNVRSRYNNNFEGLVYSKILKQKTTKYGYKTVDLCIFGKRHHCSVHRLVASAFIENPYNLPIINHKDECKANNAAENLEWCTQRYNVNYGYGYKARNTPVCQFDLSGVLINKWESMKDAEAATGVKYQSIHRCCKNRRNSAGGYMWRYGTGDAA